MVSKKKSDWPPAGWNVEIKVSNGRNIKCYINSRSGKKFYSKLALLRYIKDGNTSIEGSRATQGHAKKSSNKKQMHLVDVNDSLELPPGWTTEWRTRKSGVRKGTSYKCFIDPSTGSKFFSKPEVYRYLESLKGSGSSSGQKESGSIRHSSSNRSVDSLVPHNSKLEPNVPQISKPRERKTSSVECKVIVERTTDKELPSGWIKEMRNKMRGDKVVRRDPFYYNPATGLVFRSKPEVLRYIETGEVSRHAYRRRSGIINVEQFAIENTLPTSSGNREKTRSRTRKQLFGDEESRQSISELPESVNIKKRGGKKSKGSASRVGPSRVNEGSLEQSALSPEPVNMAQEMLPERPSAENVSATKETEDMAKLALPIVQDVDGNDNHATLEEREPSSVSSRDILVENKPEHYALHGCNNGKSQTSKRKTKDRKSPSLPFRSSKRLAGVEAEVVFHSIPIEHARLATKGKSNETKEIPRLVSVPSVSPEQTQPLDVDPQNVLASQGEQSRSLDVDTRAVLAAQEESLNENDSFTQGISKEVALQTEQTPLCISQNEEIEVSRFLIDQSLEDPENTLPGTVKSEKSSIEHPIPEVQPDKPTGTKIEKFHGDHPNLEEQPGTVERETEPPGSQFCFPSPLWSDPCLEFAFKTLTGAIPLDDNLAIEDYIQHQLRTSSTQSSNNRSLPDMGLPSGFQNDETKLVSPLPEDASFPNSNGFGSQKSSI